MSGQHTPEPWENTKGAIVGDSGEMVTDCGWEPRGECDARRIVACVNACRGIQTVTLEAAAAGGTIVGKLAEELSTLRALLIEAVEELPPSCAPGSWGDRVKKALGL